MKKRFVVFFHLIPVIFSLLLIGAHFLRTGNVIVTVFCLLLSMALCVREPLVARTVQVALLLASAEWIHVAYGLVSARLESGLPWTKLVIILGAVTALSLTAFCLFYSKVLKEMYHLAFAPRKNWQQGMVGEDGAPAGLPQPEQTAEREQRQKLLTVHALKSTLAPCSLLAFLLMDFSIGLGMGTLLALGLINYGLRSKLRGIGGSLTPAEGKKLYVRQTIGLGGFALLVIGYYTFLLPTLIQPLIVGAIIAAFSFLLWAAARYEYVHIGPKN